MARPLKNKKDKQVVAYKRALISAKAIQKDKALESEKAEQFLIDIQPYLTKKGVVRKNLSKKKVEQFNKLIEDYKKHGTPTKAKVKKKVKKASATAIDKGYVQNEKQYKNLANIFQTDGVKSLIKGGYVDSDTIIVMAATLTTVTPDLVNKAAKKILSDLEDRTPAEAREALDQDDVYQLLIEELQNINEEDEEIPFY